MKRSDATGSPRVARWWLDVATVVLWHPASLRSFAALRTLYPDAMVHFLSPDFESIARHAFHKLKTNVEETLQRALFENQEVMSSVGSVRALLLVVFLCFSSILTPLRDERKRRSF